MQITRCATLTVREKQTGERNEDLSQACILVPVEASTCSLQFNVFLNADDLLPFKTSLWDSNIHIFPEWIWRMTFEGERECRSRVLAEKDPPAKFSADVVNLSTMPITCPIEKSKVEIHQHQEFVEGMRDKKRCHCYRMGDSSTQTEECPVP